jgi:hypothetical protein
MMTSILKIIETVTTLAKELINILKQKLRYSQIKEQQKDNEELNNKIDELIKSKDIKSLNESLGYIVDTKQKKTSPKKVVGEKVAPKARAKKTATKNQSKKRPL